MKAEDGWKTDMCMSVKVPGNPITGRASVHWMLITPGTGVHFSPGDLKSSVMWPESCCWLVLWAAVTADLSSGVSELPALTAPVITLRICCHLDAAPSSCWWHCAISVLKSSGGSTLLSNPPYFSAGGKATPSLMLSHIQESLSMTTSHPSVAHTHPSELLA